MALCASSESYPRRTSIRHALSRSRSPSNGSGKRRSSSSTATAISSSRPCAASAWSIRPPPPLPAAVAGQRLVDQLALDPTPNEVASDPLVAPAVEQPPILGKAPRIAGVIEKPLTAQGKDHIVDDVRLELPAVQEDPELMLGALTHGERAQSSLYSALVIANHELRKAMRTGGWQGRRTAIVLCTWPTED